MRGITLALSICLAVCGASAQYQPGGQGSPLSGAFINDLKRAGATANVGINDGIINAFGVTAENQPDTYAAVYKNVSGDERVSRLARYLTAKAESKSKVKGILTPLTGDDLLVDFNWFYLTQDLAYHPVRFEGANYARLETLEGPNVKVNFGSKGKLFNTGEVLVLPTFPKGRNLTVTLDSRTSKLLWTGSVESGELMVSAASTSKGCEIDVKSKPPGAVVRFNGTEWRHRTNTKSVRDPGLYEVKVQLDGYKEWREARFLQPGASWVIDVNLEKQ